MAGLSDRQTLALTRTGDLKFNEHKRLEWAHGAKAVAQEIKTTLKTIQGEDPIVDSHGLDVFSLVNATDEQIKTIFTQTIMDEHGDSVKTIRSIRIDRENVNRTASVTINLTLENDENVSVEVES